MSKCLKEVLVYGEQMAKWQNAPIEDVLKALKELEDESDETKDLDVSSSEFLRIT